MLNQLLQEAIGITESKLEAIGIIGSYWYYRTLLVLQEAIGITGSYWYYLKLLVLQEVDSTICKEVINL